jgi:hypothetical protein
MQQRLYRLGVALLLISTNCTASKPRVIPKNVAAESVAAESDVQLLEREHREFADYFLGALRGLHHETCACDANDYCRPLVDRVVLDTRVNQLKKTITTLIPHAFPQMAKEIQKTTDPNVGARIGDLAIKRLPRSEQLRWLKMVSSCWGAQSPERPPFGEFGSGKPVAPSAVRVLMTSCEEPTLAAGVSRAIAIAKCACMADYFISLTDVEAKSVIAGSQSSSMDAPTVAASTRCNEWAVLMGTSSFELTPYSSPDRTPANKIRRAYATCIAGKSVSGLSEGQRQEHCDRTVWYDLHLGEVVP